MCLYEQMVVVIHKAVVMQSDIEKIFQSAKSFHEVLEVLTIMKDYSLFDTSVDYMVEARNIYTRFSWHGTPLFSVRFS